MPIINNAPPPTKGQANTSSAKPATPRQKADTALTAKRKEAVEQLGTFATVPLVAMKQFADVGAISQHWSNVSNEIAKLADSQEEIARLVDPLMKVGPYAGLIAAVLPMALQVAVNHGRVSPGAMGTVPPVTLSSQIEAQMAKEELMALRIQRDAEREAAEVREQIANARREFNNAVVSRQTVVEDQ